METITDATGLLSCYYSAAAAETTDLVSQAAAVVTAVADPLSGFYLFFAAAVAVAMASARNQTTLAVPAYERAGYPKAPWITPECLFFACIRANSCLLKQGNANTFPLYCKIFIRFSFFFSDN